MSDTKLQKLASHFANYWVSKSGKVPEINIDVSKLKRTAEKEEIKNKEELSKSTGTEKSDSNILGMITGLDDLVEKSVESKIKTLLNRIIEEKLREILSKDFAIFEKAITTKITKLVEDVKPAIIKDLNTVTPTAPATSAEKPKAAEKTSGDEGTFTELLMEDMPKSASVSSFIHRGVYEIFPNVFIKATRINGNYVGELFVSADNDTLTKLAFTVDLPKTKDKGTYITALKHTISSILKD